MRPEQVRAFRRNALLRTFVCLVVAGLVLFLYFAWPR
jgi:hypothetical protein